jgi:hypothetical protein
MKKVLFVLLIACVAFIGCQAKEAEASRGHRDPCESFLSSVLNECGSHPQAEEKLEAGVGLDIPLYKSEKLIVDQENKLNLNSGAIDEGDFSTYTVFKPQLDEGILQTAWNKIKGLFNRGE